RRLVVAGTALRAGPAAAESHVVAADDLVAAEEQQALFLAVDLDVVGLRLRAVHGRGHEDQRQQDEEQRRRRIAKWQQVIQSGALCGRPRCRAAWFPETRRCRRRIATTRFQWC